MYGNFLFYIQSFSLIAELTVEEVIPCMQTMLVNLYPWKLGHLLRALLVSFTALFWLQSFKIQSTCQKISKGKSSVFVQK